MSQVCGRLEGIALAYGDGFGGRTYHMALYVSLSSLTLGGEAAEAQAREVARQIVAQLLSDPAVCTENAAPWGGSKVTEDLTKPFRWNGRM